MVWVKRKVGSVGQSYEGMNSCNAALRMGLHQIQRVGQEVCIHKDSYIGMACTAGLLTADGIGSSAYWLTSRKTGQMRLSSAEGFKGLLLCAATISSACPGSNCAALHTRLLLSVSVASSVALEVPSLVYTFRPSLYRLAS